MNTVGLIASVIGAIILLAATVGGVWAIIQTTAKDKVADRLRAENEDYVRRLDYVEPRLKELERTNETLLKLHDPSEALERSAELSSEEHAQIISILLANKKDLEAIDRRLHGEVPGGGGSDSAT